MRIARGISIANTSKPISTAIVYDADALAFFTAASITDNTQKSAVNQLVLDLKSASIWTKMKALYPVVGGVASSHAVNLKTPGTYNLTFQVGWTHSSTGMTPNGATYADTFLVPSVNMAGKQNNMTVSAYIRTNNSGNSCDIATSSAGFANMSFIQARTATNTFNGNINGSSNTSIPNTDSRGFFLVKRTVSNLNVYQKNSTQTSVSNTSSGLSNVSFYLGAFHEGTNVLSYSINQGAFYSIGDGLTDAEASAFYTAVQTYQTTLGRQV